MSISTAQMRAARGLLNWSQQDLSSRTDISSTSIGSIENGLSSPRESTLIAIQKAFEDSGIEFLPNDGVRFMRGDVRVIRGKRGFVEFFDDVYENLKDLDSAEIFVSNVEEDKFIKLAGDTAEGHIKRMSALKNIRYKVLLKEGDTNFVADSYAEYKWLRSEYFYSVPFYAFGDKLAIFLFDVEPVIIIHNFPSITEAFKVQFRAMWESALPTTSGKAAAAK